MSLVPPSKPTYQLLPYNWGVEAENASQQTTAPTFIPEDIKSRTGETPKPVSALKKGGKGGNNIFGNRGTRKCHKCRQVKCKCVYRHVDDRCERCTKTDAPCGLKLMTKEDPPRNRTRGGDQPSTPSNALHRWDHESAILPQVLRSFASEHSTLLLQNLFAEIKVWSDGHPVDPAREYERFAMDKKRTETWPEIRVLRRELFPIVEDLEEAPASHYAEPSVEDLMDPPFFPDQYNPLLLFHNNDNYQYSPQTHQDFNYYPAAQQSDFNTRTHNSNSEYMIREPADADQHATAPHLLAQSHPVLRPPPVQRTSRLPQFDRRTQETSLRNNRGLTRPSPSPLSLLAPDFTLEIPKEVHILR